MQLWLNADAIAARSAFYAAVAAMVAAGDSIPDDWLRAAVDSPAEVSRWRRWDCKRTLNR